MERKELVEFCISNGMDVFSANILADKMFSRKGLRGRTFFVLGLGIHFPFKGLPSIVQVKSHTGGKPLYGSFTYDY